ncbi:MAG: DnaD domain protein [Eubacterium sp.]|nr:DnaD domain protein [Eubacterium sp.]
MGFMIMSDGNGGVTQVPNDILLNYIMKAGGDQIRVYLFLLMASQNPGAAGQISVEILADRFDMTERDISRILNYWKREGLLSLMYDDGKIMGITLHSPSENTGTADIYDYNDEALVAETSGRTVLIPDEPDSLPLKKAPENTKDRTPERTEYKPDVIDALCKDNEMQQTLKSVERALNGPITAAHMQLVMYLICDLRFDSSLVRFLYETGARRGKTSPKYLEAIALSWADNDIHTVEEARSESESRSGKYRYIFKALGIHRDAAPAEVDIITGWDTYGFSEEIIEEACKRTVLQTGDTNLNYVSSILSDWNKKNVRTIEDIKSLDEAYKKSKVASVRTHVQGKRPAAGAFRNFRGRDYSDEDYENMELQFLQQRRGTQ